MPFASSFRRASALALAVASLFVVAGCSGGGDEPAPVPNITVNPLAAPPPGGAETNAGPGSSAATDSTLN
ncbi:hypothetical protein ElP_64570 [Tautonia plasticadhaerens]|uniref:Uncharacterized protein n=1 Tax=Tautonia plasticadhaerens TaxID=2527974 RepID=A0A518HCB4_9BACT|nr:hypothetical protein ElP_64570 [Tautonia plasticadhaerens]